MAPLSRLLSRRVTSTEVVGSRTRHPRDADRNPSQPFGSRRAAAPVCFSSSNNRANTVAGKVASSPGGGRDRAASRKGGAVARHVPRGGAWCGACVAPMSPRDRRCLPRFRIDLAVFLRWQARKHVLHIGIRIMPIEPCRLDQLMMAAALAPRSAPANSQFERPIAQGRIWFSTIVVDRCIAVVKVARQRLPARL